MVDSSEEQLPGTPLLGEMCAALPRDLVGSASSPVHLVPLAGNLAGSLEPVERRLDRAVGKIEDFAAAIT